MHLEVIAEPYCVLCRQGLPKPLIRRRPPDSEFYDWELDVLACESGRQASSAPRLTACSL